jgi:outer membrane biosynthesis protein TonB
VLFKSAKFMDAPWPLHEPDPKEQRRDRFLVCLALSLAIHGVVLAIKIAENVGDTVAQSRTGVVNEPLTVRLNHVAQPESQVAEAPPPKPQPRPTPRRPPPPAILAVPTPNPTTPPIAAAPPSTPVPPQRDNAPVDMMAMVNAARARRRAMDAAAARENAAAAASDRGEPTPGDATTTALNRNLASLNNRQEGVSGIFTILSMGSRTSSFAFRGWTASERSSTRQVYEVDAGDLGDVKLATIRRMIQLIRTHYSGDFNWESHRLGRTIVMSARPADNTELEAFLMKEMFEDHR